MWGHIGTGSISMNTKFSIKYGILNDEIGNNQIFTWVHQCNLTFSGFECFCMPNNLTLADKRPLYMSACHYLATTSKEEVYLQYG